MIIDRKIRNNDKIYRKQKIIKWGKSLSANSLLLIKAL